MSSFDHYVHPTAPPREDPASRRKPIGVTVNQSALFKKAVLWASLLHGGFLLLLLWFGSSRDLSQQGGPTMRGGSAAPIVETGIVKAVAIDEHLVEAQKERLMARERAERLAQAERQAEVEKAQQFLEQAKKQQLEEQKRLEQIKSAAKEEQKKLKQLEMEKADLAKKQLVLKQKLEAKQKELKAIAEAKKKGMQNPPDGSRPKSATADDSLETLLSDKQAQRVEHQLSSEVGLVGAPHGTGETVQGAFESYAGLWKGVFDQFWNKPAGTEGLSCDIQIQVAPDGVIQAVHVVRTSEREAFDQSAVRAVWRASPLKMATDPAVLERLREVTFRFKNTEVQP